MNVFNIISTGNLLEILCLISMGCLMITGAIAAIIISKKVFNTSEISPSDLLIGIIGATLAELLMLVLAVLTLPLGGEILHRCAIISVSILVGVPIILSIKDAIADRNRKKSVASAATVTVKSIKKEEIPGQLNMSKSTVRKIKSNQKRYKKHK